MRILSPETDNCLSWISGRERMTLENISWSISTKEWCRPRRGLNPRPPGLQSDGASNWANLLSRILSPFWRGVTLTANNSFKSRLLQKEGEVGLCGSVWCASDWWSWSCGLDPRRVGNILSWRLIMEYFLRSVSPFRWFKKGSCHFWRKNMHNTGNR